jgi:hypothetical protein
MSNPIPQKTGRSRLRLLMMLVLVGGSIGGWFYYQHVQAQDIAAQAALESLKPAKRVQVHSLDDSNRPGQFCNSPQGPATKAR